MTDKKISDDGTVKLSAVKPTGAQVTKVVAAPKAAVVKPVVIGGSDASVAPKAQFAGGEAGNKVKKAVFFDRVAAKGDLKKNQTKPAIEAALQVISEALLAGEELHLPPLGKIKVQNKKDVGNGAKAFTLKLRTPKTF